MKWRWLLIVAMLVIAGGAVFIAMGGIAVGGTATNTLLTAQATRRTVTKAVAATGTVASAATYGLAFGRDAQLGASSANSGPGATTTWPVSGVKVAVGDAVTKGETLATADTTDLNAALNKLQVSLASAQVTLQQDKDTLASAKSTTQQQLDSAVTSARIALLQWRQSKVTLNAASGATAIRAATIAELQAHNSLVQANQQVVTLKDQVAGTFPTETTAVANAQSAVDDLQTQITDQQALIAHAVITSPVDGTASAVNVAAGYDAPSGDAIVITTNTLQVVADVVESDLNSVSIGQAATVTITALSTQVTGKVTLIAPASTTSGTSSVVSYPVTVTLENPGPAVKAGMSSNVTITVAEAPNVIAVPSAAVKGTTGNYTVSVPNGSGGSTAKAVTVGLVTNSYTEIQSGIAEGDSVVIGTLSSAAQAAGGSTVTNGGNFGGGAFPIGGGTFNGGPAGR
jgi:macrolide-specific efflux system membrane fusion protein